MRHVGQFLLVTFPQRNLFLVPLMLVAVLAHERVSRGRSSVTPRPSAEPGDVVSATFSHTILTITVNGTASTIPTTPQHRPQNCQRDQDHHGD